LCHFISYEVFTYSPYIKSIISANRKNTQAYPKLAKQLKNLQMYVSHHDQPFFYHRQRLRPIPNGQVTGSKIEVNGIAPPATITTYRMDKLPPKISAMKHLFLLNNWFIAAELWLIPVLLWHPLCGLAQ
jgi:hypothetical protein